MADLSPRDQAFAKVDLMTAELEMTGSIYDGFSTAIVVKGQPRTVGLFREFDDAVQVMALIENNRQTTAARAKPLDWRRPTYTARDYGREECELIAPGLGGVYGLQRDGDHWMVWQADDEFAFWKAKTREEAKAKAEADWQWAFSAKAAATVTAWVVSNADETKWRSWDQGGSIWVDSVDRATRYARREDAELVHAEDEDAWTIKPYPHLAIEAADEPQWIARVMEAREEHDGHWAACSGCQESVDGYVSQEDYPYSAVFGCQPGGGCSECGGLGAKWDNTDYDAMANSILADVATEEALNDKLNLAAQALEVAAQHIQHMAAWISKTNARDTPVHGYSFEALGEDKWILDQAITTLTRIARAEALDDTRPPLARIFDGKLPPDLNGYKPGDEVRVLEPCKGGAYPDNDSEEEQRTSQAGARGRIDSIAFYGPRQGWAVTVAILDGPGEGVVNVFDELDPSFPFEPWASGAAVADEDDELLTQRALQRDRETYDGEGD